VKEPSQHFGDLVKQVTYKPGWLFYVQDDADCPVLKLMIVSETPDSYNTNRTVRVRHEFMVPPATYNRDVWAAWIFDRVRDVESHEAGEFFQINGLREFAPHHGNGEDPYRVWHVGDHAATRKKAGQD
jgi:hypothetical protein